MSLTTVAATIQPDQELLHLPPSKPERFLRSDFIAAGLIFLVTLAVYVATLAPNVTLEDSGELITAAAKFGVGHPPGYPLWTMSGFFLSHVFPFGNLAWRINLLSALFGAASNAVLTLLVCHSGRWLLQRWTSPEDQPLARKYVFYAGLLAGLSIGFSDVMWSQATISAVHGTIQALFVNLVLLLFYLWMLEPQKNHRLILAVFVFSLGLTNHHTLVQVIPAFLLGAALLRAGKFWSVFIAVNLFSLSILVYISWLSSDPELQDISAAMAKIIFGLVAVVSFFYLKEFRLRLFLIGALTAVAFFAYGHYILSPSEANVARYGIFGHPFWLWGSFVHPGWLQMTTISGVAMLGLAAIALGLLYTSKLDRNLVIGLFAAGWVGLVPYAYESFASATHPPMNWGYPKERSGFYYAVSREQYPKSLPNLIKTTIGKTIGVVPKDAQLDTTIGLPNYSGRLWKTFYYYGDNLQSNFTVPLIALTLAILLYIRRSDWPQVNWFIFLGAAFFLLGFMLLIIAPQEGFDYEHNLQYKVFHLQSHCIFVLILGYGSLAIMIWLRELMPEFVARSGAVGFGVPALFLSLLPLWSNFDGCSQAGHWYGYYFGADIMRDMDKNAVYYGGSDPGRFVPTYMAFVESQQNNYWKREPDFDRRDVTVITQNALCDDYYCHYIRDQYDERFRPKTFTWFERWLGRDKAYPVIPVTCLNHEELLACWDEYQTWPDVAERVKKGGPVLRQGTNDVFDINGIVARKIFEKNKKDHTFYLEQSVPIDWMYSYLLPFGLIFKFNPEPMGSIPLAAIEEDRKYWDAYSARLLNDPRFCVDDHARITFAKLAFWHSDLYRWRNLPKEQEYWLRMSLALCPKLQDAVMSLSRLLSTEQRYDEAIAAVKQALVEDPRNENYTPILTWLSEAQVFDSREQELRNKLAKSPYDVPLNLDLARLLEDEGKFPEVAQRLQMVAGMTNWTRDAMTEVVRYYVDRAHHPDAALAFMEARAKIEPTSGELIYSIAALHATLGHQDEALKNLAAAAAIGGTNALMAAKIDPAFVPLRNDPRYQRLLDQMTAPQVTIAAPDTNMPATNAQAKDAKLSKPAKK